MRRWLMLSRWVVVAGVLGLLLPAAVGATTTDADTRAQLAGLRLPFIANEGQADARVAFYAPTFAGTLFVTAGGELTYALPAPTSGSSRGRRATASRPGWTLTETLQGRRVHPVGQDPSATGVSYFLGNEPARWRPKTATYDQLRLGEVWPGVTVTLRARGRSIEKVFTVQPGASATCIRVRVSGASALALDSDGALVARTGLGPVTFTAPIAYQERDGVRRPVAVAYRLTGREYGFTVAAYDPALPLVIDPLLQATYLGGTSEDIAQTIAIHPTTGDVYVAGTTTSGNFPATAGGAQPENTPQQDSPEVSLKAPFANSEEVFVARLTGGLTSLVQATYLGGSGIDGALALAIHPTTGDVYVAGFTTSTNFPGTGGVPIPFLGGGAAQPAYGGGNQDGFVARLTGTLTSLTQATYLGGSGDEDARALAIHPTSGDVYVAGGTTSTNFPATGGGAQPANAGVGDAPQDASVNAEPATGEDAFVARLSSDLSTLRQATYFGGTGIDDAMALAIHPVTGEIYVAGNTFSTNLPGIFAAFPFVAGAAQPASGGGEDAYVARLNTALTSLLQATYLGGSGSDGARALAIHPTTGDVYVAGSTGSTNFPGTSGGAQPANGGSQDAFVARLSAALTSLLQATYLGGSDGETGDALAIHPTTGDVYVAGDTGSANFPKTGGGVQPAFGGAGGDAFVARLTSALTSLLQATYLGGSGLDGGSALAINRTTGDIYVAGSTTSTNFPSTAGGAQPAKSSGTDAFVVRLTFGLAQVDPALSLSATVNQTTFSTGQTLVLGGGVNNPGLPATADFYVGIVRPDNSIQFFTNAGIVLGNLSDLTSFRPLAVGVPLGTAFTVNVPNFFSRQWSASDQHGLYTFFLVAVTTGPLTPTVPNSRVLGLATAPFVFP